MADHYLDTIDFSDLVPSNFSSSKTANFHETGLRPRMPSASSAARHLPLENDLSAHILRVVAYFDVFHHPLSLTEVERFTAPGEPEAVREMLRLLVEAEHVERSGRYVHLLGRRSDIARREARAWNAEETWPIARRAARVLSKLPFVDGLMITGALSKNSVANKDDIDFLVFVRPGHIWTTKTLLQVARAALPNALRECFCTNYLVSSDALALDDRTMFTAIELATAVPAANGALCKRFIEANAEWARTYVPGLDWSINRAHALCDGDIQAPSTAPTSPTWLDRRCLSFWEHYWNRKYGYLDERTRAQRFKRRADRSTNHLHDFQTYVLDAWEERCEALGVPSL